MSPSVFAYRSDRARSLSQEVVERSGQNIYACYQCRRCASGCTVGEETGMTPDRMIRLIITGNREEALNNPLVWQCVSCYTCGTRCPNLIQSGRITETLKKMSKEAKLAPVIPNIAFFHDSFVHGCTRWGRVNEIEFMGYYEMKNIAKHLSALQFNDAWVEISGQLKLLFLMFKQKRLHFKLDRSRGRREVKNLYKVAEKRRKNRESYV